MRKCECGAEFLQKKKDHKFCSNKCWRSANREKHNAKNCEYYWAKAPEYREKRNAQARKQWATDTEYREKRKAKARRDKADPEFRKKENAHKRARYATDPEYRKKQRANALKGYIKVCAILAAYREKVTQVKEENLNDTP